MTDKHEVSRDRICVVAVVQARLTSERLPGKVLLPIQGQPMIGYQLEGLRHCRSIDRLVLATSSDPSDDAIAEFAQGASVSCYRGSLENVASRVLNAAVAAGADVVVRLSGDSPLLDPALVDHAVAMFRSDHADLVSNVVSRTFPKGQSVEVLSPGALARAVDAMTTPHEREHVTPYFYAHPEEFAIRSFTAAVPRPEVQLSVDDASDFARCEAILSSLGRPSWEAGWEECVRVSDALKASERP